mmetsp:Transcript_17559/g.26512  ORF Transcript_17559/g.26512 Transcript_17559/m.26512 type:complete len:85 (-) Transcript_17559:920-1174(-)
MHHYRKISNILLKCQFMFLKKVVTILIGSMTTRRSSSFVGLEELQAFLASKTGGSMRSKTNRSSTREIDSPRHIEMINEIKPAG